MSTDIIVDGKNPTIEYGMNLLSCDPKSHNAILMKKVGLQLTLLGMAEIQAKRISNLAVAAYELEQRLYDPVHLMSIDSKRLLSTYESVNKALNEALLYVNNTQGIDWQSVINQMKELLVDVPKDLDPEDEENRRVISSTARELLDLATNKG